MNLVAAGFGLSLVPRSLRGVRLDEVVYLPFISKPRLIAEIILVLRARERSPVVENLKMVAMRRLANTNRK